MSEIVLEIRNGVKKIANGVNDKQVLLNNITLQVNKGDFITVLGGNGAGKSTLFNIIAGTTKLTSGTVMISETDITLKKEEERALLISRVFQDPHMGTAPNMTVSENLLLAKLRGEKRKLRKQNVKEQKKLLKELCQKIDNGLEKHLETPTGQLSGGQRQALSLLMATIKPPKILLLDEHTAALDPKTAANLMSLTAKQVDTDQLTCLMITHRMEDALKYGNRLILLEEGEIKADIGAEEKSNLTLEELLLLFEKDGTRL